MPRHRHDRGGDGRPWWKSYRTTAAIGYSWRHFHGAWNRLAVEHAEIRDGDRVVDVGCGPGEAVRLAVAGGAGVRAVAVDPTWPARVATRIRCLGNGRAVRVRRGSAERLPVEDGWASVVLSVNAFHHWADPRGGLAEARRVLGRGGRLVLVDEIFDEDHEHTRFHHEEHVKDPVHAGSPVVSGEWLPGLGFEGIGTVAAEDADGTPHYVLRASLPTGPPA